MGKSIRVPATTVDLVLALGRILREHLKLEMIETECWTFLPEVGWEVELQPPADGATESEWEWYHFNSVRGEHEMTVYLGSGHCVARGIGDRPTKALQLELRVRCEHSEWVTASLSVWDFHLWIRLPDGSMRRHHFETSIEYTPHRHAADRDIHEVPLEKSKMPHQPPRKIAFWRESEAQGS